MPVQLQFDLGGEDDLPFSRVGHDPYSGGGPSGIHGIGDGSESGLGNQAKLAPCVILNAQGE